VIRQEEPVVGALVQDVLQAVQDRTLRGLGQLRELLKHPQERQRVRYQERV
jgi:hypothetical protein